MTESNTYEFVPIEVLAQRLRLPIAYLSNETCAGRIPCLKVGIRTRYNPAAVVTALNMQASEAAEVGRPMYDANPACFVFAPLQIKRTGWILDDPDVCDQVDKAALKLSRRCGHSRSDLEDLKQDIRLHLIQIEGKYDRDRGSVGAFVNCTLKSWVQTRIRYRLQQRRKGRLSDRSFEESDPDLDTLEMASWKRAVDLVDHLDACLLRLSREEVQLLVDVVRHGQAQTADAMGISRRQVQNRLEQIRMSCADLEDFPR